MQHSDFDSAIPVRQHAFIEKADGKVAVLVPRFTGRLARRLFVPLLARPEFRMHLDALGSAVWKACDGRTTVAELTRAMESAGGGPAPDVRQRVYLFLRKLQREGSISFLVKEHD
jgi:hypothetical protein